MVIFLGGWCRFRFPVVLGLLVACGCRGRAAPRRSDAAAPIVRRPAPPERAALLLVDAEGAAKMACLPGRGQPREIFSGVRLLDVFNVTWRDGGVVAAAQVAPFGARPRVPAGAFALLAPGSPPRILASGVRTARFSPSGDALAFETAARKHVGGGAVVEVGSTRVLELASGKIAELGELVDARWEADGQHLRATRLGKAIEDRGAATAVRWTSYRVRWERASEKLETWGRGSAQIPAPIGSATAWSEDQRGGLAPSHCAVRLGRGGHQHPIVGPFCAGLADDRGVRWSPDGRWLAFPRPGPVPGERQPGTFFIDVVGIEGGRHPALSALYARVGPGRAAMAGAPGTVAMDWSPAGRFLAVQDGVDDLRVYDFEARDILLLGKGTKPTWSPGGGYLLVRAATATAIEAAPSSRHGDGAAIGARVLPAGFRAASIDLGPTRDVRWLPAEAYVVAAR
jgi:hypothetical protein